MAMRIDHVIFVAADLGAATTALEEQLGVRAAGGGRHEGLGTHNAILPLGGGYLEVLAVCDETEAAASPLGAAVLARLAEHGEGLHTWVAGVDDVEAVAWRLGTPVTTIRRDGFGARLTGVAECMRDPSLPFFIERDPGVPDPGADGDAGGIMWLEVAGDTAELDRWLGGASLPLRFGDGPRGLLAAGIGERELRRA
jgi:hypothetical protein